MTTELPSPETMLTYASILEKQQYVVKDNVKYPIATGEIVEAACAALRVCARQAAATPDNTACCKGLAPLSECQCEIERLARQTAAPQGREALERALPHIEVARMTYSAVGDAARHSIAFMLLRDIKEFLALTPAVAPGSEHRRWTQECCAPITPAIAPDAGAGEAIPLADHDEIGRKVSDQPWEIQLAIITIAAHCTALTDEFRYDKVADLAGCISQCCSELADLLARQAQEPGEGR